MYVSLATKDKGNDIIRVNEHDPRLKSNINANHNTGSSSSLLHSLDSTMAACTRERKSYITTCLLLVAALLADPAQSFQNVPHRQHSVLQLPPNPNRMSPLHIRDAGSLARSNNNMLSKSRTKVTTLLQSMPKWEGDDIRWSSRLRRRMRGSPLDPSMIRWKSAKTWLILTTAAMYFYEVILTILKLKRNYAAYWPSRAAEMVIDSVWGGVVLGPLASAFGFSAAFSSPQPHRFLTSGFVHSGMAHLFINMVVLQNMQPGWLETGLGTSLYLSTFVWSILGGNAMHLLQCASPLDRTLCLGASSAICGLYGLMYVCMVRMGSGRGSGSILRGLAVLIGTGLWLDHISMAANAGGFLTGLVVGILCGPRYMKDYSMRRKNSVGYDPFSRDYRLAMGFGISPTNGGMVPVALIWIGLLLCGLVSPSLRSAPLLVWKKLVHPT